MPWDRVHDEAEVLEHYISEELERRIADKLGNPTLDPHGDPIPTRSSTSPPTARPPLAELGARPGRDLRARLRLRPGDAPLPRRARDPPGRPAAGHGRGAVRRAAVGRGRRPRARARRRAGRQDAGRGRRGRSAEPGARLRRRGSGGPGAAAAGRPASRRVEDVLPGRGGGRRRRAALARRPRPRASRASGRSSARRSSPPSPTSTRATSPPTSPAARKFGYLLLWVVVGANLIAMVDPDPVGEARDRHRQEPAGALPRDLLAAGPRSGSGSRPRSSRCRATSPRSSARRSGLNLLFGIPLFPAALIAGAGAFAILALQQMGLPAARGRDRGARRSRARLLRVRDLLRQPERRRRGRPPLRCRASAAPRACCWPPGSSARP